MTWPAQRRCRLCSGPVGEAARLRARRGRARLAAAPDRGRTADRRHSVADACCSATSSQTSRPRSSSSPACSPGSSSSPGAPRLRRGGPDTRLGQHAVGEPRLPVRGLVAGRAAWRPLAVTALGSTCSATGYAIRSSGS